MIERIKNKFTVLKYSFSEYKRLIRDKNKSNKVMVNEYLERSEKEKPRYIWYEWLLIGAFHVMTAIPFTIAGLILELRDWIKRRCK